MNQKVTAFREYHRRRDEETQREMEAVRQSALAAVREAVRSLASAEPAIERVGIFGSLLQPGRFRRYSDVDIALLCDNVEAESRFWSALEERLERNVDIRPWGGSAAMAVEAYGEVVYEREVSTP